MSLAAACCGFADNARAVFRLAFHFALFQTLMPLLGWLAGRQLVEYIDAWDHWAAFVILGFLGGKMIYSGVQNADCPTGKDPSRGWELVMLSLATSIDALAVGVTLAFMETSVWYPVFAIGAITAIMCVLAIALGKRLGLIFGKRMEILRGIILIAVGIKLLLE